MNHKLTAKKLPNTRNELSSTLKTFQTGQNSEFYVEEIKLTSLFKMHVKFLNYLHTTDFNISQCWEVFTFVNLQLLVHWQSKNELKKKKLLPKMSLKNSELRLVSTSIIYFNKRVWWVFLISLPSYSDLHLLSSFSLFCWVFIT